MTVLWRYLPEHLFHVKRRKAGTSLATRACACRAFLKLERFSLRHSLRLSNRFSLLKRL